MAWRRGQVVKAEVCKTSIHRFDSGRRLHLKKRHFGVSFFRFATENAQRLRRSREPQRNATKFRTMRPSPGYRA